MSEPKSLDEKGRCCGRKPIVYKRPSYRLFCDRCCAQYNRDGEQVENWAYQKSDDGFVKTELGEDASFESNHLR